MGQVIDVPGHGPTEFPDGMTDEQIVAAIQRNSAPQKTAPNSGMMALNSVNKGIAAIPDSLLNVPTRLMNLGKAAFGSAATAMGRADLAPAPSEDPNFVRQVFDKVGFTKPQFEPQTPGQRIADSAIQGGVSGLASPANGIRQAITNTLVNSIGGAAGGAATEAGAGPALSITAGMLGGAGATRAVASAQNKVAAMALRQQQNAVRDQTIDTARGAGYVISPSETNPGAINQALEGIAGKLSTRQLASQRNQEVTNQLARQDVGIPESMPITKELLAQLRQQAFTKGYEPVTRVGPIRPGGAYRRALDDIESKYTGASSSFPDAVRNEVGKMVEGLRVRQFDAGDAVKMTQILRDDASKSYASGDKALGKAQSAAAGAIEDQLERGLQGQGKAGATMLDDFRDARRQMAKTHTLESALVEGTGNIQASKLAAALRKGAPLQGGMKLAASAAEAFPKNMQSPETMGAVPGISPLDVMSGAGMGAMGAAATGSPSGAMLAALPAIRPIIRSMLLSAPYQNSMGKPNYKNSALTRFLAQGDIKNPQINNALLAQILAGQVQGE